MDLPTSVYGDVTSCQIHKRRGVYSIAERLLAYIFSFIKSRQMINNEH